MDKLNSQKGTNECVLLTSIKECGVEEEKVPISRWASKIDGISGNPIDLTPKRFSNALDRVEGC